MFERRRGDVGARYHVLRRAPRVLLIWPAPVESAPPPQSADVFASWPPMRLMMQLQLATIALLSDQTLFLPPSPSHSHKLLILIA